MNSTEQLDMSSFEDTNRGLAEDVASLTRVRNRFSRSSDKQLNTIMPALIPKLFQRLENYSTLIMNENEDNTRPSSFSDSALFLLQEAKTNIYGIIANALERLRGNGNIPTESLVIVMLPFIDSKNPVVATWASAFLQVSIQRIPLKNFSLSSSIILPLLESIGQLHKRLTYSTELSTIDSQLETQWVRASWLLLDSIVLNSGQKPMIDWDIDSFDTARITRRMRSSDDDGMTNENQSCPTSSLLLGETTGGFSAGSRFATQGFFSLVLDLLLYWPRLSPTDFTEKLSPLGVRRMEHRSKILLAENTDDEEQMFPPFARQHERDLPLQIRRARLGIRRTKWSDASTAYLRYMKLACLEFAISPSNPGMFPALNNDHATVLSILFACHESMHGRIAISYLNKWGADNSSVPLPVATSILVLIVGEAQAQELLDSFREHHKTNFWEPLLGSKSNNQNIRRPAIDWEISLRAAKFLIENSLKWRNSTKTFNIDPCVNSDDTNDEACATLLIELSLKLSEVNDDDHKFLAMRLISNFYSRLQKPKTAMVWKIFDLIISVLTILANSGIEEDLRTAPRHNVQTPAGIPRPFHNRNDLNKLLQCHRQAIKRKTLNRDNAIQARENAYTMISLLSAYTLQRSDASRFQIPILLLQCAVFEDRRLENCLTRALDSTLAEYKKKFDEDQTLISKGCKNYGTSPQQQATFILPALLETVCSQAVNVRMNAIQWIQKLLVNMDAEAACYLASHLVHDENPTIARMAKSILDNTKINSSPIVVRENFSLSIIDLKKSDGLFKIQNDLKNRSKELSQRLQISSFEESMVVLLHFKFSVTRAEFEYRNNPEACRELCGLVFDEKITMKKDKGDDVECGICYEEMQAKNAYSLPCGHTFCKDCWVSYVTDASNERPSLNFLDLRCPHHGCSTRVMLHDLKRLDSSLIPKWNDAILRKFIEEDASYRYCSGPDCGCVAVGSSQSPAMTTHSLKVTCDTCSTSFCFWCGQNAHAPASCPDITKWNLLKGSSQLWVKLNSKP